MGLIVITPLAGFVSPGSAIVLGLLGGPVFLLGERIVARTRWLSDPVGLLPGRLLGGRFGVTMIAFFAQTALAAGSGHPALPNGLLFGGGSAALHQLGLEMFGPVGVMAVMFRLSFLTMLLLARVLGGIREPVRALATDASGTGGPSGPKPAPVAVDPGPVAVTSRRTP